MSVFNDRDARSKLSASNKGRCVLGGIALLVSVDREKRQKESQGDKFQLKIAQISHKGANNQPVWVFENGTVQTVGLTMTEILTLVKIFWPQGLRCQSVERP